MGWVLSEGHAGADDGTQGIGQSCGFSFSHYSLTGPFNHLYNSQHFGLKQSVFVFTHLEIPDYLGTQIPCEGCCP